MEKDENKNNIESGNKLVTVAIHSYEKAVILGLMFKSNDGIFYNSHYY